MPPGGNVSPHLAQKGFLLRLGTWVSCASLGDMAVAGGEWWCCDSVVSLRVI